MCRGPMMRFSETPHCLALLHCTTSKRVVGSAVQRCAVPRLHSAVIALHCASGQCSGMLGSCKVSVILKHDGQITGHTAEQPVVAALGAKSGHSGSPSGSAESRPESHSAAGRTYPEAGRPTRSSRGSPPAFADYRSPSQVIGRSNFLPASGPMGALSFATYQPTNAARQPRACALGMTQRNTPKGFERVQ